MNQVIITGRLGKDAYFQAATDDKKAFAAFDLAVNQGQDHDAMFVPCKAFGATAEKIGSKDLKKGDLILVQGSLDCSKVKDDQSGEYYGLGGVIVGYTEIQARKTPAQGQGDE